jgi:hypothetical protein
MTAYIINTSKVAATTVNLIQGRVQIAPLSYCELHEQDLEKARKYYNSKDLNLFVAESEEELNLLLPEEHKENENENDVDENNDDENDASDADENEGTGNSGESDNASDETSNIEEAKEDGKDPQEGTSNENEQKDANDDDAENDQDQKKAQIKEIVALYLEQGNLDAIKDLASKLEIRYMPNIRIDTLASRILDSLS